MGYSSPPKTVYWLDNTLYLNVTNKCSSNCYFCLKRYRKGVGDFNLKLASEPTIQQITAELENALHMRNWAELVFCGFGEPTERLDVVLEVTRWVRTHYGRPLPIRLNTNGHGYVLNPGRDVVDELQAAGIERVSVSLNASDRTTYEEICKPTFAGAYEAVLDFIRKAKAVLTVEVSAVRLPEVDLGRVQSVADELGVPFRVREYIPCFY
ncbi:MAG: TatD family nuclease-associated radical SAM protein [Candidatus Bathyarchaeota archaeon]|nr:TatD family nuclease-associated radical SAM protein [Candidatus Bathyarchaeota archaeon]